MTVKYSTLMCFIRTAQVDLSDLIDSPGNINKQPLNCHLIFTLKNMLNPGWCTEICDITFSELSPANFKLMRKKVK